MKKLIIIFLLALSFVGYGQVRSDLVIVPTLSSIGTYQGGSKVLFVTDTTVSTFFHLYQGPLAVNGTSIVSGANSSKWRRMGLGFNAVDSSLVYSLGSTILKWSPTTPTFADGFTLTAGVGVDTLRLTSGDRGDITVSNNGLTWSIDNGSVALTKLPNIATSSFVGRNTAGTGQVEVLTATQATALLDIFTTSVKGLVPAATGGNTTTEFLRKDGTWAVPAGGGGMSIGGTVTSGTVGSVLFLGASGVLAQNNTNLYWDNTNFALGIGINPPTAHLHIFSSLGGDHGALIEASSAGAAAVLELSAGGMSTWKIKHEGQAGTPAGGLTFTSAGVPWYAFTDSYVQLGAGVRNSVTTSGAGTLTIGNNTVYVFTGTTTTWTLPTVSAGGTGRTIFIKNRGTGAITLNSNAGGNDIYNTSAVNTISVAAGASLTLINDGTFYNVIN